MIKYGNIQVPGLRHPTVGRFNLWKRDFIPFLHGDYSYWLCGAFLEGWDTKDVDVVMLGDRNDEEIERILCIAHLIAYRKYQMMLDLQYWEIDYSEIPMFTGVNVDDYLDKKVVKLVMSNRFENNGHVRVLPAKRISDNLYERYAPIISKKHYIRMVNGTKYQKSWVRII